jgi:FixJ family two-component response regulator
VTEKNTILIVDDEKSILSSFKRVFITEPYEILSAGSGTEALEKLQQQEVQLIISDQRMAGMNGIEFLSKARDICPKAVRVVLSGYSDFGTIVNAINKGQIYKFIEKPWKEKDIRMTVKDCFDRYKLVEENRVLNERVKESYEEIKILNEKLEESLHERSATLINAQEILNGLPIPIIGVDSEGEVTFGNKATIEYFGGESVFYPGLTIDEFFPEQICSLINQVLQSSQTENIRNFNYNHGSKQNTMHIHCFPLGGQDEVRGIILSFNIL